MSSTAHHPTPPLHDVETRLGVRIPVRDGVELSANLWLPVPRPHGADQPDERFPAILEMIPYGKDSWRRNADVARGGWLAARGYALCRLDVRGTGSSPGIALDEYTATETTDGYDAVEWLAAQPWCTGDVAMWGISYGGFTAIQVAKLRPPHLRAIVPVMATDDRYLTDVHYIGGCVTASELSQYAVSQVAMNAMPPDPDLWGPGWRDAWRDRLERTPPWLFEWLRHQVDGPYWRQGSLAPDYDAIEAAIFQVGGWMDSYIDPIFRMHERCTAPRRSLVGNWVHDLPDSAYPGPNVNWLPEMVRFLDEVLGPGKRAAPTDEPGFTWLERDYTAPETFPATTNGRWRATTAFPHPAASTTELHLATGSNPLEGRLLAASNAPAGPDVARFPHRATWGTRSGLSWGAGHPPNGLARDLRPDEALVPAFTSDPLVEPLEILGLPEAILHVAADVPVATVVVRLADVAPDGTSALVSAGVLNLTHRRSHAAPEPLEPGRIEEVRVPLRAAGYRWLPGHRVRISVGSGSWPILWPSPYACTIEIHHGGATPSRLVLPVVPPAGGPGDVEPPAYTTTSADTPAETDPPDPPDRPAQTASGEDPPTWRIDEDVIAGTTTVHIHDGGWDTLADGRRLYAAETIRLTAHDADPARAELDADVVYRWRERTFETEIRARSRQSSTVDAFVLDVELEVDVDGERFFERAWSERIPRHLV
ncbi:MAG TPA: CocE/NonD family hydrolase [Candidatus Limnocylindrales bacterium]|nr:CocE/NonD family hydrolase [Candidatus Limnocylindrales bacterium]